MYKYALVLRLVPGVAYACCADVQSQLLPIPGAPAAGSASPQLQDYTLPGAAAAPQGLLGFLCDAFTVLLRGTCSSLSSFDTDLIT